MTLTVEDGTGVSGADSYASIALIDAYWSKRPHTALAAVWTAGSTTYREGAAREATAYLDAAYGPHYPGLRRGHAQGLLFPRIEARDRAGYDLPDLPPELIAAACELAPRALQAPLAPDLTRGGMVKRKTEKIGPIEETTEYSENAIVETRFGVIDGLLAPILDGTQPGSAVPHWRWR